MYDAKTQLLVANPIDRYLINSPMLPELKFAEDGSLTIYMQDESPGAEKEATGSPRHRGRFTRCSEYTGRRSRCWIISGRPPSL